MSFDHRISAAAVLAAASLAFSPAAWSLGLGDVTVESWLNQPLQARIDLISQPSDDLASMTARLASAADYELIGASLDSVPVPIRFSIEGIDGDAYILATSSLPINNPVLRLIVEVNWSSGRMLREYTLFLDPPTVAEPAPPPPRVDQRKTAAAPPPAQTAPEPRAAPQPAPATPRSPTVSGQEYGPVQSGDTLWEIASDWSAGSGLGINRVMIAIQRENPNAFANGNINLLKRGAILRMPTIEQVENIPSSTATQEVVAQQERLAARRAAEPADRPVPLIEEVPAPDPEASAPAAAEPMEPVAAASAPDEPAEPAAATTEDAAEEEVAVQDEPRDLLELVPPSASEEPGAATGLADTVGAGEPEGGVVDLRESLARTEEELINQRQQNAYLEERVRELESRLQKVEEGTAADPDLANMEDRLRDQRQAAARAASQPWYRGWMVWLIGLLVLAAALVGWLFSRRGQTDVGDQAAVAEAGRLRDIQSDAEEVLRTLNKEAPSATRGEPEPAEEAAAEKEATVVPFPGAEADARVLDEESSDPEIQLDLARAYISMGDKEAARVILQEVISNGTERQRTEARKMLDLLRSP